MESENSSKNTRIGVILSQEELEKYRRITAARGQKMSTALRVKVLEEIAEDERGRKG